ncbi:hypothetical protein R3P38DRAFT_602020 [Favolaschia claudopus]|uniref:Uncharacterized protein n=1 Tax=Favolaschia claudopus TaxID=2862362 RepID=A0AAW0C8U2_9AGAR
MTAVDHLNNFVQPAPLLHIFYLHQLIEAAVPPSTARLLPNLFHPPPPAFAPASPPPDFGSSSSSHLYSNPRLPRLPPLIVAPVPSPLISTRQRSSNDFFPILQIKQPIRELVYVPRRIVSCNGVHPFRIPGDCLRNSSHPSRDMSPVTPCSSSTTSNPTLFALHCAIFARATSSWLVYPQGRLGTVKRWVDYGNDTRAMRRASGKGRSSQEEEG